MNIHERDTPHSLCRMRSARQLESFFGDTIVHDLVPPCLLGEGELDLEVCDDLLRLECLTFDLCNLLLVRLSLLLSHTRRPVLGLKENVLRVELQDELGER